MADINDVRMTTFEAIYREHLAADMAAKPRRYGYGPVGATRLARVIMGRIRIHGAADLFLNAPPVAATLDALNIRRSYKAVDAYLAGAGPSTYGRKPKH